MDETTWTSEERLQAQWLHAKNCEEGCRKNPADPTHGDVWLQWARRRIAEELAAEREAAREWPAPGAEWIWKGEAEATPRTVDKPPRVIHRQLDGTPAVTWNNGYGGGDGNDENAFAQSVDASPRDETGPQPPGRVGDGEGCVPLGWTFVGEGRLYLEPRSPGDDGELPPLSKVWIRPARKDD